MAGYADLQDWELLQSSDDLPPVVSATSDCGIDHDYFALDYDKKGRASSHEEEGYLASDESSDEKKSVVSHGEIDVGLEEGKEVEMGSEGIEVLEEDLSDLRRFGGDGIREDVGSGVTGLPGEELGANNEVSQVFSVDCVDCLLENSSDDNVTAMVREKQDKSGVAGIVNEIEDKSGHSAESSFSDPSSDVVRDMKLVGESNHEKSESGNLPVKNNNKLDVVWWKFPLELAKYCVFKVKPVWSFSAAVALIGFVVLGRRLYRLKHRSQTLPLRLGIDDKKASQSVNRAARLNEAFSTMRRVALIKTSLPTNGITPWPAMALS